MKIRWTKKAVKDLKIIQKFERKIRRVIHR